jgi:hypothetical protein
METENTNTPSARKMPDLPPMALVTLVGSIIACATSFGLDVTVEQREAIEDLMRNLVVIGGADYLLRMVRNACSR